MVSIFSYFLVLLLGFLVWESCFAQGVDNFGLFLVVGGGVFVVDFCCGVFDFLF